MCCIGLGSYAQIQLPALSPAVEISQKIGLNTATLSYSRPSLRGRDLFGEDGILVLGDSWTFHFNPYEKQPYTAFLEKDPLLEITVPLQQLDHSIETFSLHFEAIHLSGANLVMQWDNYKVEVPIKLDEHEAILANIDRELTGPTSFQYFQAALYLHETQTDLPLALSYIQKATQGDDTRFFMVYREALILKDLDRKEEAMEAAMRTKKLAQKAGNDDIVRLSQRMLEQLSD